MIELTIDNNDISEFDLFVLRNHENPLLPNTQDNFLTIPGRHGVYDMGSTMGPKYFNIPLGIRPQKEYSDLRKIAEKFTQLFMDPFGKPKLVELRFNYLPERYYLVKYTGSLPIERLISMGRFTLPLVAPDPFAYSLSTAYDQEPSNYDSGVQYDSGLMYENYDTFNWTNTRQYFGNYNHSFYVTKPKITIQGAIINPRITNIRTGKWIQLPSLSEKDTLIVDFNKFTILKNNQNAFMHYRGDFFDLESGDIQLLFEGKPILKDATWGSEELTFEFPFELGLTDDKVGAIVKVEWLHKFM